MQNSSLFDYIDIELDLIIDQNSQILFNNQIPIFSSHYQTENNENLQKHIQFLNQYFPDFPKKIVLNPNTQLQDFHKIINILKPPYICFIQGEKGKITRVFNQNLTPVFDQNLSDPTGQGQMQKSEIFQIKQALNIFPKKFYIFGNSIKLSPTPHLYSSLFQKYNLEFYQIERVEVQHFSEIQKYIKSPDFNAGIVTMPFKQDINHYVDFVYGKAVKINPSQPVINTILQTNSGKIVGFNSDYDGVYRLLKKKAIHFPKKPFALLVGAGGTSKTVLYCLKNLKIQTILYSRSPNEIKEDLYFYKSTSLEEIDLFIKEKGIFFSLIVSSIPGISNMELPKSFIQEKSCIFDVSYIPKETWLIKQAIDMGCQNIIYGIDMICTQAILQSSILLGRKTDQKFIRKVVLEYYNGLQLNE
ncbi:pentafunctional polypeptide, putative [Ichthyophthirius multifiliis]|uniref:Pentafunctional polypeptide, putative n=1 Tax=Ichthyophthirius multifiliis TaxID=5932 RepID=G0QTN7_ICHMU|nr:pentafunctional polypeptide, putative [Ichthyophthirius multifiliis]EGR31410.1 pentafunctional polypeptide, putative [Ichthyophthirius multifiliis]|eukprot:XP_004034896.1 pentafunctional polypeptide, putative [Ichthyophthirius multifiliis]